MFDLKPHAAASLPLRDRAANISSVGTHEHREAAKAVCQPSRHRCLAMLVSSYRTFILCHELDSSLSTFAPTQSPAHSITREQVPTHA